jgi:DNA polymerase (family 10)
LKADFPPGITDLLEIPGIGPRTAKKLSDMGITTIDDLEKAAADGSLEQIEGLGTKTAATILHRIETLRSKDTRIPIGQALPVVEEVLSELEKLPGVKNLTPVGSLRRCRETVGDIDLMGTADNPVQVIEAFVKLPQVKEVLAAGPTKASVIVSGELQVDLRIVEHDSFGSLLQYFTGSKQHNILLRSRAQRRGLKLSEYGITDAAAGKLEKFGSEQDFYRRLGMQYIPPELREGGQEIELAERGDVPELIRQEDIKGDLHVHTNWSDGHNTLEDMADAARRRGYGYLAVTDHSGGLGVAHGLSAERLQKQIEEIRAFNKRSGDIRLLAGTEVDIKADGSLAMPDEVLAGLDIVIAAIHAGMNQPQEQITARFLSALENPHVDIIAHPTCRLIGTREPVAVDLEAVYKSALKYNKALEINAMPSRLDLGSVHVYRARELGVKLTLGTDAHYCGHLDFMRYGVGVARRGWCRPQDILNTRTLADVLKFLGRE